MKIEQIIYSSGEFNAMPELSKIAEWVLVFGSRNLIEDNTIFDQIRGMYPFAYIMGCSSSGEIQDNYVSDEQLNITAVHLEKSSIVFNDFDISSIDNYFDVGIQIMSSLETQDLKHIFILTEGVNVNGSRLVAGMRSCYKGKIPITGGLAGDGADFIKTAVLTNNYAKPNCIVVAAFYGGIKSGYSSYGGWDTFGIERIITKSEGNVLYEIDGKPALNLYKEYLGEKAKMLPTSALWYPLSIRLRSSQDSYVRTVSAIDEKNNSLIFAADIPQDSYCKLMKANVYNLIDAAKTATELSMQMLLPQKVELGIIISCFGRKMVLKQRTDEEIEIIRELVGQNPILTGFYSYGEIAPNKKDSLCEVHNQTMTVTLFSEG